MGHQRQTPSADPAEAAKAAGLRYTDDAGSGLRRLKSGKGFRYVSPDAKPGAGRALSAVGLRRAFAVPSPARAGMRRRRRRSAARRTLAMLAVYEAKLGLEADAARHATEAVRLLPADPDVLYRRAVVYALSGSRAQAFDALAQALSAGYPAAAARQDHDLASLHREPAFERLLAQSASKGEAVKNPTFLSGPIELVLVKEKGKCSLTQASKDRKDKAHLGQQITWRITNGTTDADACGPIGEILEIHDFTKSNGSKGDPVKGLLPGALPGPGLSTSISGTVDTDPRAKDKYKYKVRLGNTNLDPEIEVAG